MIIVVDVAIRTCFIFCYLWVLWEVAKWLIGRFRWLRRLQDIANRVSSKLHRRQTAWYRKGAGRGDAACAMALGEIYAQGLGVARDYNEALNWYRMAADQGVRDAQMRLGWMYGQGTAVAQDQAQGLRWYREAAVRGDAGGQHTMASRVGPKSTISCE